MKAKDLMRNYITALDKYRDDPNRTHKDLLMEAEYDVREKLKMPKDHLEDLYRRTR